MQAVKWTTKLMQALRVCCVVSITSDTNVKCNRVDGQVVVNQAVMITNALFDH